MLNRLSRYRRQVPRKWRESKPLWAAVGAVTLVLPVVVVASSAANAGVNLTANPGAEQMGPGNFPLCWGKYGSGKNTYSIGVTNKAHSGSKAIQVTISERTSGQRSVLILQNQSCAPRVTPGHQYDLGVWYMSNTPDAVISLFRHDVRQGWQYWMDLKNLPVSGRYKYASVRTPQVPANTDQISWGVTVYGKGTVLMDDYSTVDATAAASPVACSAGAACTKGAWQVLPFLSPVRSIHSVLMYNGKVLLVAGSGNDPNEFNAGTFESAVYDPSKGTFQVIPTPDDFFCAGHVQLPDGKVLVLGGNKAYPTTGPNAHGYEGLNTSYIFDPVTDRYVKENNLNDSHWYPSATELGNGDVISYGGLDANANGSVTTEYFKYNPNSSTDGQWLPRSQINETYTGWGLYPDMILTQNGRLFYTGSHVFGNNETPVGDANPQKHPNGAGWGQGGVGFVDISHILNPGVADANPAPVNGLQDNPGGPPGTDMTDQSMAILLPPAQSQKVMLMGGGNIDTTNPATRLTDLISLNSANPHYTPGPLIPRGKLSNGQLEPANEGKMYVSMVILPNGQVFETGGGLIDREDPVYEASMYNPNTNTFTSGMATDPVPRTYHSQSFLLPDGRVMSIGNNPGDGSFNMQISIYSPPYLFHGARPQITSVATPTAWHYGKSYNITVNQKIVSAELIRPAAVTHQSDPNQRFVALPLSVSGNHIGLNVTSNPNIAPPGWYMLFVTNANGVPSVAKWVHVS
jgi:Domain of unknown function (DUF1929)